MQDLRAASQDSLTQIFESFPHSLTKISLSNAQPLVPPDWNICFEYSLLQSWGDTVLVARLKPANQDSKIKLEQIVALRRQVNLGCQSEYGQNWMYRDQYEPHVSLAYFGNQQYGHHFSSLIDKWHAVFQKKMKDNRGDALKIILPSISLYGFTNMATFFKVVPK